MMKRFLSRTSIRLLLAVLFVLPVFPFSAAAQPDLNFKRIRLDWPMVEVYLSVGCNGIKNYFLTRSDIVIREDGREIDDFGISCPDPSSRCPISVGLVFDASDSMVGEGNVGAKDGGYNFVRQMDGTIDEGCVVFFNYTVTVHQQMTSDTAKLRRAISRLPAIGSTALWDGTYMGLMLTQTQGSNTCRAVIVLTDGEDNSSRRNLEEIIAYAVEHNIRVFPIGYGSDVREDQLKYLAQITGGKYYHTPDASALAGIYREISTIMYEFFQECVITYEPRCADGARHDVELGIPDLCGGSAWSTRTYTAPMDSSTFSRRFFSVGSARVSGGAPVKIPITLESPYLRENLYPLTIDLAFDRRWLKLDRIETPPGTLLENIDVHMADLEGGGRIRTTEARVVNGSGILCYAVLQSTVMDTSRNVEITVDSAAFTKGCIDPVFTDGMVEITPSAPGVSCVADAPDSLIWDGGGQHYLPEPFELRMVLQNRGTRIARDGYVRLDIDTRYFEPVEPGGFEQSIGDIALNGTREVRWKLRAKAQGAVASAEACLRAGFSNHADVVCCREIRIPTAGMMLSCDMEFPDIRYDTQTESFVPNPCDLRVQVRNVGQVVSDSVTALVQLPQGLYIESGQVYEKAVQPGVLQPNEAGDVTWKLRIVSSMGGDRLPVRVQMRSGGSTIGFCYDTLTLPLLPAGFTTDITPLGSTTFCEGDSVVLDAGEGYIAYRWSTGQTSRTITVHSSGTYFITVMDHEGRIGRSGNIDVEVHVRPPMPDITRERNTLYTTALPPLQWYRDGMPIPGANSPQLDITEPGTYTVETWVSEQCRVMSQEFPVTVVGVHAAPLPAIDAWTVYPEPAAGEVTVRIELRRRGTAVMRIMNMLGQIVMREDLNLRPGINTFHYDLSGLRRGVYLIRLRSGDQTLLRKLVRQ